MCSESGVTLDAAISLSKGLKSHTRYQIKPNDFSLRAFSSFVQGGALRKNIDKFVVIRLCCFVVLNLLSYYNSLDGGRLQVLRVAYNNIRTRGFSAIAMCLPLVMYAISSPALSLCMIST